LIRIILVVAVALLIFFLIKFIRLMSNYKSASRPNVDDLKDKASYLGDKYKNAEEADFRDIKPNDKESESPPKNNA
jgi:hypothetical protein